VADIPGGLLVSDLLSFMSALNNELDINVGGADETRAIVALNMALLYCVTVAASLPHALATPGIGKEIKTAGQKEFSPLPSGLLRIDALFLCDLTPSADGTLRPIFKLSKIFEVGAHMPSLPWPLYYVLSSAGPIYGAPRGYFADDQMIYWDPVPDQVYAIRPYGLWRPEQYKDRNDPIHVNDLLALPIATFAGKYCYTAVGDATDQIQAIATEFFTPALRALRKRDRSRPGQRYYEYMHTT
jgi:hypothetical protein